MDWYSITAQCLTPIEVGDQIDKACGIYQQFTKGESLQDAITKVMETIAAPYKRSECPYCAVLNYDKSNVTILDDQGHIINFYWGFVGHRA